MNLRTFLMMWFGFALVPICTWIYLKLVELKACEHCFHFINDSKKLRACCYCDRHERLVAVPLAHGKYMSLDSIDQLEESDIDYTWIKYSKYE